MASCRCYDSSDVIAILIMTNFPLYLMQLWRQFFPKACLWRRSLCSNLAGIDSEKLYRATFICQYGLFCCMALVSFRLFCKNLGNLQEFFGQMDYRPPWQKIARTPMTNHQNGRRTDNEECSKGRAIQNSTWKRGTHAHKTHASRARQNACKRVKKSFIIYFAVSKLFQITLQCLER